MSLPPDPAPLRFPVSGSDMLLVFIFGLGSVRVLGAFVIAGLGLNEPGAEAQGTRVLLATVMLLSVQTVVIFAAVWSQVIRKHGLSWADLGLRLPARGWYRRAIVIAIALIPAVALINLAVGQIAGTPFENPQIYAMAPSGFSWSGLIVMLAVAGVVAPISEEIAFRGLFFPWLRERIGLPAAVAISAFAFALPHGAVQLIPALTVIGAVLAVFYHRCGSLWPVIVAHGAFNSIMIIALYAALAAVGPPT